MLVVDLMTTNVITIRREAPVAEALKIMHEHGFRRLPVVDEDGRPVGVVSQRGIETLKPQSALPALWQMGRWASNHTVDEVMHKKLVTVKPTDTVEHATAKAQTTRVGALLVVEESKVVGIVTTNDIFYRVVNPTLGIGEPGTRIVIIGGGTGEHAEKIISIINRLGVAIKVIWGIFSPTNKKNNLVVHLDTDDARAIIGELAGMGYRARMVNR
jgi:acetoin utilization protein AcuB